MAGIERDKKLKKRPAKETQVLTDFPAYTSRLESTIEHWASIGVRKVGDIIWNNNGYSEKVVKIETKGKMSVVNLEITSPYHSFLAYYDDISSNLAKNYNFKPPDSAWVANFEKKTNLTFRQPKWLAEFDAYLQGNFSPEVRSYFFPNREKYHLERTLRVENLSQPPTPGF